MLALFSTVSCGGSRNPSALDALRAEYCPPADTSHDFQETPFHGGHATIYSFQNIRASLNSACASCHQAPASNGGFSYTDSLLGQQVTANGEIKWYPGFTEAAEKMRDYILNADETKRMPPASRRASNPQAFLDIGHQLDAWIGAGKPNGTFEPGKNTTVQYGKPHPERPVDTTDLGNCIPTAKAVGSDFATDRRFEVATELPKHLSDTDLTTLDPYQLAQTGTLAYNVEYPLWADNAEKGRWIHVPMRLDGDNLVKQSISFDAVKGQFNIPDNTRFYKTFYRAIILPNKQVRMRRMETRLIVSRTPWQNALFGTYQWDETEQIATLVDAPYRDGTPWKDLVSDVIVEPAKNTIRPYAIPGRQRCIDCHMGSPMGNFVLGFQPIQINKRPLGGGGRIDVPATTDLDQVKRFIGYGILSGIKSADELPVLEHSGSATPRNIYELRASGYAVGNCYHCHNANGLALTKENGVELTFAPGDLFGFNTHRKSVEIPTRRLVHQEGDLDSSQIWRKVSDPQSAQGLFNAMPMHTAGAPDCRLLTVMGQWISSFQSEDAAYNFTPSCKKQNPWFWIDTDFTWVDNGTYVPRRADWNDPAQGMPQKYRDITLTPSLQQAIQTQYAVGYWLKKSQCQFPPKDLPPEQIRPWMMNGDKPKRPFGEIYYTTPGSYFFRNTCMKCHGPNADGVSALARGILNWSGGQVRVANFMKGLFGGADANLKTFDVDGKNYAGQYLIWMAMGGTRVNFPPELSDLLGKHGGQMLNGIREKCLAQISSDRPSSPRYTDFEVFNKVCFMENLAPGDPSLAFDPDTNLALHPDAVEAWLDKGAWNAGWAIFDFLKNASAGNWLPAVDQCEKVYGKAPTP